MPAKPPADHALARARLLGKRAALGLVIAISVAVIVSAAFDIIPAVFGARIRPVADRSCAEGVRRLAWALDRALPYAGGPAFATALEPEWGDAQAVGAACGRTPEGLDAWAALARLRWGEQQLAGGSGDELASLRRDVVAHLPADLR